MSFTYKNILVPVDYSACSYNALTYAAEMALSLNAKLYLYHAYRLPIFPEYYPENGMDLSKKLEHESKINMDTAELFLQSKYSKVKYECLVENNFLMDGLGNIIRSKWIDLVIMGTKGADGLDEYLVGSNAARVIESEKCPVLVVPEKAEFHKIQKVLFATDFQFDDVEALKKLTELIEPFESEIMVLHAGTALAGEEEEEMDWFKEISEDRITYPRITYKNLLKEKDILTVINNFIDKHQIDMVTMSTLNKNFVKRLFTGSLTKKMAYHTHVPMLIFHTNRDNRI